MPGKCSPILRVVATLAAIVLVDASLKHPMHGRNQHSRPMGVKSLYNQLDNTDYFRDNIVPVTYRKSARNAKPAQHEPDGDMDGLNALFDTWKTDGAHGTQAGTVDGGDDEKPRRDLLLNDWLTWEEARVDGQVGPMRVTFVTEFWDQGATMLQDTEHCAYTNQYVTPSDMTGTTVGGTASILCTEEDVIDDSTVGIVKQRLSWVRGYVNSTFQIKQVQAGEEITINSQAQENYPFSQTTFTDTDLIVVVTLHPISAGGIAGYAYCAQSDQFGRCTVGYFNWVPDGLSTSSTFFKPNVAMSERTTALHEVMHVLGCCKDSDVFRNPDDGTAYSDSQKWVVEQESPNIDKQVTKWVTPGVVATAQEQFNCSSITGVPLEDVPLGANAHWEARIMGPEVMSYGIGSGESYVSALTLMFFNDTNQYIVDLERGTERLYPASGEDDELASTEFEDIFAASDAGVSVVLPNRSWGPGYQRWGRNAGCAFFQDLPSLDTWTDRYFCTTNNQRGCTGDNLLSAACYLLEYSATANDAGDVYYTQSVTSPSDTVDIANDNAPYLPAPYQYLAEHGLTDTAGYSSSMDFAPVRYGIWNCQDQEPTLAEIAQFEDVDFVDPGELFSDAASEIAEYGGQIFSSRSRCFESSLLLFTEAQYFSFEFTSYGLCYLSNCYTEDYLQVGLKTALGGVKWFRCQEAGEVYVSGFIGSFTCPDPTEFCAYEDISGVKYTENNETLEWIFWGVLLGVILVLFIVFCCCKKVRQCTAQKLKKVMNFDLTQKYPKRESQSPGACLLTGVSVIWHVVGLGLVIIGVVAIIDVNAELLWETAARQVYHFIGLGAVTIVLATLGTMTAKADHPTLKAAIYFYILLFVTIAFIFIAIIVFAIPSWLAVIVELTWATMHAQFPDSWQLYTATEAWEALLTLFEEYSIYIYIIIAFIIFSLLSGLIVAFIMLEFKNVIGTMLFWMNIVIFVAGIIFLWACSVISTVLPTGILVGLIIPGCLVVIVGVIGVATCRHTNVLIAYMIVTALTFVAMLAVGIWLLSSVDENQQIVSNLTQTQLGELALKLEFFASEWTASDLQSWLEANLQAAGIAAIILSLVVLGTVGAAVIVLRSSQVIKKKMELQQAAKRMDVSGAREWENARRASETYGSQSRNASIEMGEIRFAEPVYNAEYVDDHRNQRVQRSGGRV